MKIQTMLAGAAMAVAVMSQPSAQGGAFTYRKVMIPVRDGVKLETVILTPANQSTPLPILIRRSPYGVPSSASGFGVGSLAEFVRDGYILSSRISAGDSSRKARSSCRRARIWRIRRRPARRPTPTTRSTGW